jgi:hypothetical protein
MLDRLVCRLNADTGSPREMFDEDNKLNRGHYELDHCSTGYMLQRDGHNITDIRMGPQQMYYVIHAILNVLFQCEKDKGTV